MKHVNTKIELTTVEGNFRMPPGRPTGHNPHYTTPYPGHHSHILAFPWYSRGHFATPSLFGESGALPAARWRRGFPALLSSLSVLIASRAAFASLTSL
jgi:hypothetical protein